MIDKSFARDRKVSPLVYIALTIGLLLGQVATAATITLSVESSAVDASGQPLPVTGFRYLVEEDTTYKPALGVPDLNSLSFSFHKSHNPVATNNGVGISGSSASSSVNITVPDNKNYFVSVVPFNGHALGGAPVEIGTANVAATVRVNAFPIPTAQISIFIFEDNNPVNGAPDQGERGLSHSIIKGQKVPFAVTLFEPAGQYGGAGGRVIADAYGNVLGTEYHPTDVDADGMPVVVSTPDDTNGFVITPDDNGYLVIKHLPPGKYGVEIVPPMASGLVAPGSVPSLNDELGEPMWIQTSTIEGTRTIDAWVKANEPETFIEFGPPGPHVFVGFVRNFDCMSGYEGYVDEYIDANGDTVLNNSCAGQAPVLGGATIRGTIVSNHMSRPGPVGGFEFFNAEPFGGCRVAVNQGIAGKTIYSQKCDANSGFEIDNLAAGSYSLSIWDDALDVVIANHPFTVAGNDALGYQVSALLKNINPGTPTNQICDPATGCDLGNIPVFNWFHKMKALVFQDLNQNGIRDCVTPACNVHGTDDVGLRPLSSAVNLRWRDGRIYKAKANNLGGEAEFSEIFPFFHWLVAEVDFAQYKATGATMIVDAGGNDADLSTTGYTPQPQERAGVPLCSNNPAGGECTVDGTSRTETGAVLTQAFQGFLGQKNTIEFGKANYAEGENGGISGMAMYAITRAEDDPRYAAAEEWEPGIPRVQVALFQDFVNTLGAPVGTGLGDQMIDDINGIVGIQSPDVDNHPLGWGDGTGAKGPEDIDHNNDGLFDFGDAIDVTWTDSWDDNLPNNCGGLNALPGLADTKCFDGLRNWNQIRPGVFDGGYAFDENLPEGDYIVQSYTPPGYTLLKEEDKNVDFGDEYAVPQLLPPVCVGAPHTVPALLSHVTADGIQVVDGDPADYVAPYAGETRPLCDTKHIRVADGKNAAADFHYFTEVPKGAHVVGGVINDLANEFDPASPTFGEKFSPPWLPVAFYDFKGHEITRVYTDQYGKYNAMLPSTNTVNIGSPSGMSPNMITACMNDGGLVDNPGYANDPGLPPRIVDPNYNPQYSQFCYTFQYMPGGTTYLDTPVVSVAAFAGAGLQLDCDAASQTPLISSVSSSDSMAGPYVANQNAVLDADRMLTIKSTGLRAVPNPSSDELTNKFVNRDYGFGSVSGIVELVDVDDAMNAHLINGFDASSWTNLEIAAPVPLGIPDGRYQLVVTNANGASSPMGVTVTVGALPLAGAIVREVFPSPTPGATPLQDALDAANPGDLILVAPGRYDEKPIMYKPVNLQGAGAYSTVINARTVPAEKIVDWQNKVSGLYAANAFDLLPGQQGMVLFDTEAGPGLMVVGKRNGDNQFKNNRPSRIDGFTVTGADTGGGVFVNGYIEGFSVSNNVITGNNGTYGGGIRVGHHAIKEEKDNGVRHPDAKNRNINIHHNSIAKNGNFNGAGGGIALYTGSSNYRISDNLICGNFASTDGAGIGHLGKSSGGVISDNKIIFNQSFRQTPGMETDGGGILIAGADSFNVGGLTAGSGHVQISRNLIQGNQAGAGDGAGIALRRVNGKDIFKAPGEDNEEVKKWWHVTIDNNTIVNNVAGYAGGAISLLDAARVDILNNTIANNESTATAGAAFALGSPGLSSEQVAGIVSREHVSIVGPIMLEDGVDLRYGSPFSNPIIENNIILENRARIYDLVTNSLIDPVAGTLSHNDLGVVPSTAGSLTPMFNLLTDATGYDLSNIAPVAGSGSQFVHAYVNVSPFLSPSLGGEFQTIQVAPALDEGGNWLDVRYAPLSINDVDGLDNGVLNEVPSDYHLVTAPTASIAIDAGDLLASRPGLMDIDRETGNVGVLDMGSDEVQ